MRAMDRILELTAEVERQIEGGDWAAAAATDAERRGLLVALLDSTEVAALDPVDQQSLQDILRRTNDATTGIGCIKRDLLATTDKLRNARRALHSYRQNENKDTAAQLRD
jgi:hypothetical protein